MNILVQHTFNFTQKYYEYNKKRKKKFWKAVNTKKYSEISNTQAVEKYLFVSAFTPFKNSWKIALNCNWLKLIFIENFIEKSTFNE